MNFSVVSIFGFGTESDLLGNERRSAEQRENLTKLLLGINFTYQFPWLVKAMQSLPESLAKSLMPPGAKDMLEFQRVSSIA